MHKRETLHGLPCNGLPQEYTRNIWGGLYGRGERPSIGAGEEAKLPELWCDQGVLITSGILNDVAGPGAGREWCMDRKGNQRLVWRTASYRAGFKHQLPSWLSHDHHARSSQDEALPRAGWFDLRRVRAELESASRRPLEGR